MSPISALLSPSEQAALADFLARARELLGDELIEAPLFGSRARGEGHEGSDLDRPWLQRVAAVPVPPAITAWDLGRGESAVLSWAATHPGASAILDDYAARRVIGPQNGFPRLMNHTSPSSSPIGSNG